MTQTAKTNQVSKREWYETLINDMTTAIKHEFFLEAIFIEYILIDDRLKSICDYVSISIGDREQLGSIINKINIYITTAPRGILVGCLNNDNLLDSIEVWKNERNNWMHNAGNEKLTYNDYKTEVKKIALDGESLAHEICDAVQRLRKQANKL